jgi:hypothetical protein
MLFRNCLRALLALGIALGILFVIIGSVLLAWNILADPYVLTLYDGQLASITREGTEFKFMYDANSSWITQTGDLGGSSGFPANTASSFWVSWENGNHLLSGKIVSVNARSVTLLLTNGAGETIIGPGPLPSSEKVAIGTISFNDANEDSLSVPVKSLSSNQERPIIFTQAIVKNEIGEIMFQTQLPEIELPPYTETILNIPIGNSLSSGEYMLTVITSTGSAFISPSFTVP